MKFFIVFALRRLRSRAALTVLLIFSIALTVGVLVCVPVFSNAVSMRLMEQELSTRAQRFARPAFALRAYILPQGFKVSIQDGLDRRDWFNGLIQKYLGLPVMSTYVQVESRALHLRPNKDDPANRHQEDEIDMMRPLFVPGIGEHMKIVAGSAFGVRPDNVPA